MKGYLNKQLLLNLLIIILLNIVASFFFFRLDLTEEKRHSLNDTTKDVVKSLNDIAYVKVYLDGDLPSGFIRLKNSTKSILDEFRNYSSFIEYEFINTNDFSSIDERNKLFRELSENGLEPTNLQVQENTGNSEQIIFPGAIVYYKGRSQSLNLLQNQIGTNPEYVLNNSIEDIEFELTNTLFKLMNNNKPSIAFLDGHNGLNEAETADITHSLGQVKGSLSEYFNVERINIKDYELDVNGSPSLFNQLNRLKKFDALIIAKPTQSFSKVDKFLVDQYIMNGGKTIWFIDGVIMDMDSLKGNSPFSMAIPNDLNITDMLFKYGVRINYDLVMDFQADNIPIVVGYQGDVPQQQLLPWLYHPIFIPKSKHPIVKNLDGIKSSFVSSLDTVSAKNIRKTPLLFSSPYSKLPKAPHRVSLNILEQTPSIEQYNHGEIPVGYLLEGEFESVFTNRLAPNEDKLKPLTKSKANKMIVFGDGDLIKNHINSAGLSYPLGYNHFSNTQYLGNKRMIVNALNYILENDNIINIRAKEINLRLLNKKEIKENKLKWQLINTLLPIFIISVIISLLLLRRKRQYR